MFEKLFLYNIVQSFSGHLIEKNIFRDILLYYYKNTKRNKMRKNSQKIIWFPR